MNGIHKFKIVNNSIDGAMTQVWIDGVPETSITHIEVDIPIKGWVTVTATFLAEVEVEVEGVVNG